VSVSSAFKSIVTVALGLGIASLAGCSDIITHGEDARAHGVELYNQHQYADAAGAFNNAVRQNPRDYKSFYYLGCSYQSMHQMQQAIEAYRTGLDVMHTTLMGKEDDEYRVKIINGLASAIAQSDVRDVETNSAEAMARQKADGFSYLLVARIYALRGDADTAIEAFDHATLLEPSNFYIHKEYGLWLQSIGQSQRAQAPLRRAYAIKTDDEQVNQALRQIGVIPGPSLKEEKALARPLVPMGPIPPVDLSRFTPGGHSAPAAPPSNGSASINSPRD
jgi:Tfp pilus assembly protein PilF